MKSLILNILVFLVPALLSGQDQSLRLVFAGDIMGHDSQIASAKTGDSFQYDTCFSLLKEYISEADIAIANLEVTLAGPPYKGYPQFSSPDELAKAARDAGFDIFITANNHSLDRGKSGLERTLKVLDNEKIIHTGTFADQPQREREYPLIVEKNGIRLAILNYTYGTNGLKVQEPNIVNYIDTALIRKDLEKSETAQPDYTLVTIHWGIEYQREENREQEELASFILSLGADAIIGSHPHVVQPVRIYTDSIGDKPVAFSLGNFISNQRKRYTDGGIIFEMTLTKKGGETKAENWSYLPVWVFKPGKENGGEHFVLTPSGYSDEEYHKMGMPAEDLELLKTFHKDVTTHLKDIPLQTAGGNVANQNSSQIRW